MSSSILKIPTAKVFEPLLQPARYKGAYGGRGSGKSHFFAEFLVEEHMRYPGLRSVGIREVQKSLRESAMRLIVDKIRALGVSDRFQIHNDRISAPGGGLILFQGMQDHTAESIKSLEGIQRAWVEEAQSLSERSLELLRPTIRAPGSELWFSWNPKHESDAVDQTLRAKTPPPKSIVVEANYSDNPWFPAELETERAYDESQNGHRYGHVWLGRYEPMAIGAIWDSASIETNRVEKAPILDRVLVGVDPAVSAQSGSNETGIIVAGLGSDGRGYVLDDFTCIGGPNDWAGRTVAALDRYEADGVVIEVNQGGDMVRHTLQSQRRAIRVIEVRATRGKHVRAEPIAALYGLGLISHVGRFPKLEDQMCRMTAAGYEGTGSPDRADALVWVLTELFPRLISKRGGQAAAIHADSDFKVI